MLFEKLFNIIDNSALGKFIDKRGKMIDQTDPDRIYVENIRSFFCIPTSVAKFLCELAVKEKLFTKKTGVLCPNDSCGRIIKSYSKVASEVVTCNVCELNEVDSYEFNTINLKKITFYQIRKNHGNHSKQSPCIQNNC